MENHRRPAKRIRKTVMENHHRPAKRRREKAVAGAMEEEEDRISQLPQHILQNHILSLLPQKDAFQTCVLSKSWRHLGPTGPKIEFHESSFRGCSQKFLSVVDNTLKRYDDQKLPIQEFVLGMYQLGPPSVSLLKKWIPKVVKNVGLKTFNLNACDFSLPSVVFKAEFLTELYLYGCILDQINNNNCIINVKLRMLSLHGVHIEKDTFEKIMSSCPLIQHLVLDACERLSIIKVNKARNLKHFDCCIFRDDDAPSLDNERIEIDDAPSLETIRIEGGDYHISYNNNNFSPRLKSLYLNNVHLPTESFDNLSSNNCPFLEELQLHHCSGFTEIKLSNRSIKRLIVKAPHHPINAVNIDVANIIYFEFVSGYLPSISSFATTSRECKSRIEVWRSKAYVLSTWFLMIHEFLKSLSQSQISLHISYLRLTDKENCDIGGTCEPVVVEHLCLGEYYSSPALRGLLNCLFRICRPRYIGLSDSPKRNVRKLAESLWKILVKKGETKFWQRDLEESSIRVLEENAKEWRPGQVCEFSNDDEEVRFVLKWKE